MKSMNDSKFTGKILEGGKSARRIIECLRALLFDIRKGGLR